MLMQTNHRPFSIPKRPWVMQQQWRDMILIHYPVPMKLLKPVVPSHFKLDSYEGQYWVSVYAYKMNAIFLRGFPFLSLFLPYFGINLRTYVVYKGKPGVYFISLYANHRIALQFAKTIYRLNYFPAQINFEKTNNRISYKSILCTRNQFSNFSIQVKPFSEKFIANKYSLEYFLSERYCLFTTNSNNNIYRGDIHHSPWKLQQAEVLTIKNTVTDNYSFSLGNVQPIVHYSKGVDVLFWNLIKE